MALQRSLALPLLVVVLALLCAAATAFVGTPGASVGSRRSARLATAFWGAVGSGCGSKRRQRQQVALSRLMATRGGVAGGKVQEVRTLAETEAAMEAAGDKLVVMDFTATWCGPCKLIAPVFEALSEEISGSEAVFLKVDVDENEETARRFNVMQMPTFLFVKSGEVQGQLVGANPDKLREAVFKFL